MRIEVQLEEQTEQLVLGADQANRSIAQILRSFNLPLNTRCGERDLCAGCMVDVIQGSLQHVDGGELEVTPDSPMELQGCRYKPSGDLLVLRVPQRSRLAYAPQVLDSYRVNVPIAKDPVAQEGIGVAIDIGTTTIAIQALDLSRGEVVGRASGFNKQMHFGDDVLTRINLCSTDPTMLGLLQKAIVEETLKPLIAEAAPDSSRIRALSIAGNTTMLHLLMGVDPTPLGFAPFTPAFLEQAPFEAGQLGLDPPGAVVHLLPSIAAYIGADLTAGLFASGLLYDEGPSLLVDVGTNGEILLNVDGHVLGCATAAGPAFEGSGLQCGIRAGEGAISYVHLSADPLGVTVEKIGPPGMKPTGICGSAYVDFLSEGRRVGLLSPTGRIQEVEGLDAWKMPSDHGVSLRLAYGQGKRPIVVTEGDVAKLLQAKAAIAAGILTLLARKGMSPKNVKTLYLAGGFGMHLDLGKAIGCGLLPGFTESQIQLVGNTSLAGATLCLLDMNTLNELSLARHGVEVVELNLDPTFEDTYLDQLSLP
ncbi:MAG: DUF4445 domain-containing protein [Armatimonadetes bacterium]|nr:DUF4445 domain-containing protein [Armatimonadota bacterium]